MNSCACLFDPKKIPMCVVLVWPFKDGCFCEWIYNFFCNLPTLNTFFRFADLLRFCNGCCMEHLQRFEGLVLGWGLAHLIVNLDNLNQ
jgi:hypothetical protein